MSQPPQYFNYKKVKKSKSQGWSLPHLVTVQAKKTPAASLHTPDEQTEISAMTKEENSLHQSSPPRSPGSPASITPGSTATSHRDVVFDDKSIQYAKSEIEQDAEENAELAEDDSHRDNEVSHQHVEAEIPSQHGEEENGQYAEDDNTTAARPKEVEEKPSHHIDSILDRSTLKPCDERICDHGEEPSITSSDASGNAEAEEYADRHETTKHTLESAKYGKLQGQAREKSKF